MSERMSFQDLRNTLLKAFEISSWVGPISNKRIVSKFRFYYQANPRELINFYPPGNH